MTFHIVAMGGGGFSKSTAVTNLDRYVVGLSGATTPHVCFIPTASGDDARYINRFLTAYAPMGVRTSVLSLWENPADSVQRASSADVFLVGGGSTVNLMALWQAHGVDRMLREQSESRDLVLAGISAGAASCFQACTTDSFGSELRPWWGGMGLVTGSFCPHYDGEKLRAPLYAQWIAEGRLPDGYGVDDGAAIHFVDGKVKRYVAERRGATVHKVYGNFSPVTSGVIVEPMNTRIL